MTVGDADTPCPRLFSPVTFVSKRLTNCSPLVWVFELAGLLNTLLLIAPRARFRLPCHTIACKSANVFVKLHDYVPRFHHGGRWHVRALHLFSVVTLEHHRSEIGGRHGNSPSGRQYWCGSFQSLTGINPRTGSL